MPLLVSDLIFFTLTIIGAFLWKMKERAYKYRIYPTPEQVTLLEQTFGCVRFIYNSILRWRTDAYYIDQTKINYNKASSYLTELQKNPDFPWLNDVSCVPLQQSLRHQQTAFKNFFEGRAKYPTFKKKRSKQSAEFTKSAFKYRDGQLFIAKSKQPLNVRWSREIPSEPTTITISKDSAGRYFVSCLCRFEPKSLPISKNTVGIDLGLKDLVITSNGFKSGNPRFTKRYANKLAKAQRKLSKKKKGSSNFYKARKKVACVQAKIADCRRDFTHKLTSQLINDNQVISCESLSVKTWSRIESLLKQLAMPTGASSCANLLTKLNGTVEPLFRLISGIQALSAAIAVVTLSIPCRCMCVRGSVQSV